VAKVEAEAGDDGFDDAGRCGGKPCLDEDAAKLFSVDEDVVGRLDGGVGREATEVGEGAEDGLRGEWGEGGGLLGGEAFGKGDDGGVETEVAGECQTWPCWPRPAVCSAAAMTRPSAAEWASMARQASALVESTRGSKRMEWADGALMAGGWQMGGRDGKAEGGKGQPGRAAGAPEARFWSKGERGNKRICSRLTT